MVSGNPPAPSPAPRATDPVIAGDEPFFSARLTPYRSLGPRGFLVLMLATGAVCALAGLLFLAIGAWPVFWFFGLDVLIVYVAFRLNYDDARAFEEVHVSPHDIHVVRVDRRGTVSDLHLNPAWARLDVRREPDEGVVALRLVSHGRAFDLGAFLNPSDRESFAAALAGALATARRGGPTPSGA